MHDPDCINCLNAIARAPIRTKTRRGLPIERVPEPKPHPKESDPWQQR